MRVSVQTRHVGLSAPFRVAFGTIAGLDVVQVRLERDGAVGRGECCPMAIYGQDAAATVAEIETLIPALERGEIDRPTLQQRMPARAARNAIDCALWDLEAKSAGRTAWALADIEAPAAISSDVTIGIAPPEETARAALACRTATMVKLKLGGADDLACVEAVRSVLPDTPLFVDVNAGWTLDRLNRMAPRLAEAGVFMIEQPLPADEDDRLDLYEGAVPLCADESCHDRSDLDRLDGRYAYVNIKLDKTGGLSEALALAAAARARGFRVMTGCMLGTGLALAPAYMVASLSDVVDLDAPLIVRDPADAALRHDGRQLHLFGPELWG